MTYFFILGHGPEPAPSGFLSARVKYKRNEGTLFWSAQNQPFPRCETAVHPLTSIDVGEDCYFHDLDKFLEALPVKDPQPLLDARYGLRLLEEIADDIKFGPEQAEEAAKFSRAMKILRRSI